MRPASIQKFDRLYLVAIGAGMINSIMSMDRYRTMLANNPAALKLGFGDGVIYLIMGLSALVPLTLWFLVAYRANILAKWILVGLTVLGLLNLPSALRQLGAGGGLGILVTLAIAALQVAAVSFLFRADAKAWFAGEAPGAGE